MAKKGRTIKTVKSIDETITYVNIPLNGRWRPAISGTELEEGDFQTLTNMRYGQISPRSISGMTKINTTAINGTNLKPRSGFHFTKTQPAETHALVQSFNAGETASALYENTTAIPTPGDFTATALWTDTSGASVASISNAPDGSVAYANGKEVCVWGGNEARCAGFVVGDLSNTATYDYTKMVNNTLTDSENVATMHTTATSLDSYVVGLYHFDNDLNDASTNANHLTNVGASVTFSDTVYKFATHSGIFDGAAGYATHADSADFNFNGGLWSVDFWIKGNWTAGVTTQSIYFQPTGVDNNNFFRIAAVTTAGNTGCINLKLVDAGVTDVDLSTPAGGLANGTWYHVEVTSNLTATACNYYIFINGLLQASSAEDTADVPDNQTGLVYIGADNTGGAGAIADYFKGNLDEFRISKGVSRHIANFTPPNVEYGAYANTAYLYVASVRPLKGMKCYVGAVNTTASTVSGYYWATGRWNEVASLVDNTSTAGVSLAKTGTITFTSTVSTAKPRFYNSVYAYWYLFEFGGIDATTTISYCTVDAPFQAVKDLWDGNLRPIAACYWWDNSGTDWFDQTTQVYAQDYVSTDTYTYLDLNAFPTADYIVVGFAERMTGFDITMVNGETNNAASTITVSYWDGAAWVAYSTLSDNTVTSGKSLYQSGTMTWDALAEGTEFKQSISGSEPWYFYKLQWSNALDATTKIDLITGIPAPKSIKGHKVATMWQQRLWLFNEMAGDHNVGRCSAQDTVCVFNGSDTAAYSFGDEEEIMGASPLFTRVSGDIYESLVIVKKNEVWLLDGSSPSNYTKYRVSDSYGCVAPQTVTLCSTGYESTPSILKHVLIWQSESSIVLFDGASIYPISEDIDNYFDKLKSECVKASLASISKGFYDRSRCEYHLLLASGSSATGINTELVYDLLKKKWYQIDRGTGKTLQMGFTTKDTSGNAYTYGGIDTGFVERLDYGNTFDGTNITSTYQIPHLALGDWAYQAIIRRLKHMAVAKTSTTNSVTLTHFNDTETTSSDTAISCTVNATGKHIAKSNKSIQWGKDSIFHSIQCALITSNEPVGYEPIGLVIGYELTREDIL